MRLVGVLAMSVIWAACGSDDGASATGGATGGATSTGGDGCTGSLRDCGGLDGDDCETDISRDAEHCGACDSPCAAGAACASNTCGTEPETIAAGLVDPHRLAVAGAEAFVTLGGGDGRPNGSVIRVDASTGRITPIVEGLTAPQAIALDGDHVYYSAGTDIWRVLVTGGAAEEVASGVGTAYEMVVTGEDLYVVTGNGLVVLPKAGGTEQALLSQVQDIALWEERIYYVTRAGFDDNSFGWLPVGGSEPTIIRDDLVYPSTVAAGAAGAYAIDHDDDFYVHRLAPGEVDATVVITTGNWLADMFVDGDRLWFTDAFGTRLFGADATGGVIWAAMGSDQQATQIAADATHLYWLTRPDDDAPADTPGRLLRVAR
jgi:hypothetical protein